MVIRTTEEFERARDFGAPFDLPNHPVVGVTGYEAFAFTQWLTAKGREKGWLGKKGRIALPNDDEWEKAARGGLEVPVSSIEAPLNGLVWEDGDMKPNGTPDRRHPWGAEFEEVRCNYRGTGSRTTSTPGCFALGQSPIGVFDMSGNVREWARNVNEADAYGRVLRGGSFNFYDSSVRCAYRIRLSPDYHYGYVGFRVVALP